LCSWPLARPPLGRGRLVGTVGREPGPDQSGRHDAGRERHRRPVVRGDPRQGQGRARSGRLGADKGWRVQRGRATRSRHAVRSRRSRRLADKQREAIELLRIGSTVYLKGSAAFWRSIGGNPAAELLKGRYLKMPANTREFAEVASFTDLKKSAEEFLAADGEISKSNRMTIRGVPAIGVDRSDPRRRHTLHRPARRAVSPPGSAE